MMDENEKEVKVNKNIVVEFTKDHPGVKLVINLDENGDLTDDRAYIFEDNKPIGPARECTDYVKYLSIGSFVVSKINPYCVCYRDSSGRIKCYYYP